MGILENRGDCHMYNSFSRRSTHSGYDIIIIINRSERER